ncbi:Glutamate-gated chloride channel [Gryllus bimaculatus]|nr:Glutamate-gated chloride channel [Gryllus bimaculatus]
MRVSLRLRVMDILAVNEYDSELLLDLLLHRYWREPRIRFTGQAQPGRQYPVDSLDRDKFWTPDLYVLGMREFRPMAGSMGLDHLVLRHDQSVEQLLRATLSMRCQFNFRLFPLDSQECKMDFMSPTLPAEELAMAWWRRGQSVEFYQRRPPLRLPMAQYGARLVPCPRPFTAGHVAGNVSALRVWLVLHRHALSHVLEIYLPTGLFVVISWGSFLVKPEMVPGRMVLLVTNLLSLVTIFEASRNDVAPATAQVPDVWLVTCIVFLFFALLEYAAILLSCARLAARARPRARPRAGHAGRAGEARRWRLRCC